MEFYTSERINDNFTCIRCKSGELLYLLEGDSRCVLIDTGFAEHHPGEYVKSLTDKPVTVFLTHGHIDHAMGAPEFGDVYLNQKDISLYQKQCKTEKKFYALEDGMVFDFAPFHIEAYEFPGHTPGSMIFLIREMGILILGDACNNATFLFDESSLPLSEYKKMLQVNRDRLAGKYDRVLISHHIMDAAVDIMDQMEVVCDDILSGETDDIPFEFMGMKGYIAKKCNERFEREDGKFANIIYNKDKLQ